MSFPNNFESDINVDVCNISDVVAVIYKTWMLMFEDTSAASQFE